MCDIVHIRDDRCLRNFIGKSKETNGRLGIDVKIILKQI
jgi:hypothetical protein